jgi:hypothetical protein
VRCLPDTWAPIDFVPYQPRATSQGKGSYGLAKGGQVAQEVNGPAGHHQICATIERLALIFLADLNPTKGFR